MSKLIPIVSIFFALTFASTVVRGEQVGIEFTGFLKDRKGVRFALKSAPSGMSSWVVVGQKFAGYTIQGFEEKTETLVLNKDGLELRLHLVPSKVNSGGGEAPPEMQERVLKNLKILGDAADRFYLEHGVIRTSYDDLVGATKYLKEVIAVDGEDYRSVEFAQGKLMQVRTKSGYTISYRPWGER